MAFREKLVTDIRAYFKQSKWSDILQDQIVDVLELKPESPFNYLQKKATLRSKLDNNKHGSFLAQLLIYCHVINPLITTKDEIQNKILFLCVDKYQHTKIRRNQAVNIINALFILAGVTQKQKQYFTKMVSQELETDTVTVLMLARLLYATILYIAMKKQIDQLDSKLEQIGQHMNIQIFRQYLQTVQQNFSMQLNKKQNLMYKVTFTDLQLQQLQNLSLKNELLLDQQTIHSYLFPQIVYIIHIFKSNEQQRR